MWPTPTDLAPWPMREREREREREKEFIAQWGYKLQYGTIKNKLDTDECHYLMGLSDVIPWILFLFLDFFTFFAWMELKIFISFCEGHIDFKDSVCLGSKAALFSF